MLDGVRILAVHHDAGLNGAALLFQTVLEGLAVDHGARVRSVFPRSGPLVERARELGPCDVAAPPSSRPRNPLRRRGRPLETPSTDGVDVVFANSVASLELVERLDVVGRLPLALYVHESAWLLRHAGDPEVTTRVVEQADLVLVVSHGVEEALRTMGATPRETRVVSGWPIPREPGPRRRPTLPPGVADACEHGDRVIGAVGTICWYKGTDLFVPIAARVRELHGPGVRFVWVGREAEERMSDRLAHDVERAGLSGVVSFPGELADPSDFLAASAVVVLPSREDSWPLVMLEAAAAGTPLVCFAGAGGAERFVESGAGVAVPYLDVDAMARAIVRYLTEPQEAALAGAAGREAASAVDATSQIAAIADALGSVLEDGRAP